MDSRSYIIHTAKWRTTLLGRLVFKTALGSLYFQQCTGNLFCFPFSETQQGIFDAVLKGHIDFESDPWPLISDSAKDLIRKMLCSRPSDRLTAHEVLCKFYLF